MPNRLALETSPYLLQHKDNPVDWYPWGDEAFSKAQSESKPIFLSIGYASCHWCHVMEHESFEDEGVAAVLNEHFVCIKVDREELPDVDEAYMTAVQLTTGRGGWPMSVFLTSERKPFIAGTYFPKDDQPNLAGFQNICRQIALLWNSNRRAELIKGADDLAKAITKTMVARAPRTFTKLNLDLVHACVRALSAEFDGESGGFGKAPKFPPHTSLDLLLSYAMHESAIPELRTQALQMAVQTLQAMSRGGIHDHVGGGFHRYSTDRVWLAPHFEKMLYDNSLALRYYALAAGLLHDVESDISDQFQRVVRGIVSWLNEEMLSPEGLFYSAIDADSEEEEGKFYTWTSDEIRSLLPDPDRFMRAFSFRDEGNFLDEAKREFTGRNILYLNSTSEDSFETDLNLLADARQRRVAPITDDKALVGWNGLAISGLAEAGILPMAERAAKAILVAEARHGRLPRQITGARPAGEAYLEDYAYFIEGLLRLSAFKSFLEENAEGLTNVGLELEGEPAHWWQEQAQRLADEMVARFYDAENGGFYGTSDRHDVLFGRAKPVFDQPTPSANAIAVRVLLQLGMNTEAERTMESFVGWMERAAGATQALHATALAMLGTESTFPKASEFEVAPTHRSDVLVSVSSRELHAGPDGSGTTEVRIEIPEGMHLNSSKPPARWLIPTKVSGGPAKVTPSYPPATADRYVGTIVIPVEVSLSPTASEAEFELVISYQACTESECHEPVEKRFDASIVRG